MEQYSLDFLNILHIIINTTFKNCSIKGSLGKQKIYSYSITMKTLSWNFYLKVYKEPFVQWKLILWI